MSNQQKPNQLKKPEVTIVCRESGLDCDYMVRDTDEHEVLSSAQAHVKRKHNADYTFDQLRGVMREAKA